MPDPTPYSPGYDFTASDKGTELNVELADIAATTAGLASAITDIRRSDGALQNGIVTADSLDVSALAALGADGALIVSAVAEAEAAAAMAVAQVGLAEAQVAEATAQAGIATTQAGIAATQAGIATTQAGIAATQAGIATTQASLAAASAAAAAAAPVAFVAHRNNVDQTGITGDTFTKVAAGTEAFDQGGHYDAATARWTPPAGRYRLTAAALFTEGLVDQQQYRVAIYKNGAMLKQCVSVASGTLAVSAIVSCIDAANGTDYYEFFARGWGPGTKTVSGVPANTWFEGSAL